MAWSSALLCGLLLAVSWPREASSFHQLKRTWDTFEYALTLYAGFDTGKSINDYFLNQNSPISDGERAVLSKMSELSQDIQASKNTLLHKISDQLYSKLSLNLLNMFQYAADVQFAYEIYLKFIANLKEYPASDLLDFAKTCTLHEHNLINGLERILFRMHELLVNGDGSVESTLTIINKESSHLGILCSKEESSQQLINELYNLVINTHIKGLQIRKFSFSFRQAKEKQNFKQNIDDDYKRFQERVKNTYAAVEAAMKVSSKAIYKCDPDPWIQGQNFEQLGPVLQTHIVHSSDLPGDRGKCETQKKKNSYITTHSRKIEVSKRCKLGYMRDCKTFSSSYDVCYSRKLSPRVYDWAKPSKYEIYGYKNVTNCSNKTMEEEQSFVDNLLGHTFCLCTCDSGRVAEDRYFSLKAVQSDYWNNKVVTGAQIVKKGRVFYIQIQEGTMGPNGTIIDTPKWKPVPEKDVKNQWKKITKYATSYIQNKLRGRKSEIDDVTKYEFNTIFRKNPFLHPIRYDWSRVNLDEYNLNPNEIITGLRFNKKGSVLGLEVKARTFDFETGRLVLRLLQPHKHSYWTNSTFQGQRQEILLNEAEVPVAADSKGELEVHGSGKFLKFTTTDLRKDLGQNTVPFIDTQPITTNPAMPLSGAGLIFKRKGKSGGFLALKLMHLDLVS